MTSAQLKELELRCHKAVRHGALIGKGDLYASMLMLECGTVDAAPHSFGSPQHLLKIVEAVREVRSGKRKPAKKAEAPKPVTKTEPVDKKTTKIDEPLPEPEQDIDEVDTPDDKKSAKKPTKKSKKGS